MNFIQLIADYGTGDGAFGEVVQKLSLLKNDILVHQTSVPSFSTIATGFWTAQYGLVNPIPGMMIYTNTAPRKDNVESRDRNEGEKLMYAKLTNGVHVVGVHAGYCFSFIKSAITSFHQVNVANKGSQFRSRDFFPEAVIGILNNDASCIGEQKSTDTIPDLPKNTVAWIDGYGNIKTTIRKSHVTHHVGQPLTVTLNGITRTAYYTDGSFSVRHGELAFSPGSSGGSDPHMELFLRGLSAWKEFDKPEVEHTLTISE